MINEARVGDHYIETYGMKILQGRSFDPELRTDSAAFIINEAAAKKLGFKDPVGQKILVWRFEGTVIGLVSDFHFTSMHQAVEPLVLTHYERYFQRISIQYKGETTKALDYIEKVFKETDPSYNFDYNFTDQTFAQMYEREEKFNDLIISGSILAIIISVMGLFALTSFSIRRRIKEIGIRKTLGASVNQILILLSSKILYWIIPGILIAFPLAWWAIDKWLQNFAYHLSLIYFWWVWIVGALIALVVGLSAVYFQSVKAANANPVESLKYE
jgi:ABC-type antimicrobial peptide transport system permease subunit